MKRNSVVSLIVLGAIAIVGVIIYISNNKIMKSENQTIDYLIKHDIDRDLFPGFSFKTGEKGIRAQFVTSEGNDKSVSGLSTMTKPVVVVFRLDETIDTKIYWKIDVEPLKLSDRNSVTLRILDENRGINTERATKKSGLVIPAGLVYSGAFLIDFGDVVKTKTITPGDILRISYGDQSTTLVY